MKTPASPLAERRPTGPPMPRLGLGTYRLHGEGCVDLVSSALRAGYRHVDTAENYRNEAQVGEGLKRSGVARSEIFLITKIRRDGLGRAEVERRLEASLERLSVEYVDLLLIHWPDPGTPLQQTLDAFARVKRRGLTREIGVSNFTVALLDERSRDRPNRSWSIRSNITPIFRSAGCLRR